LDWLNNLGYYYQYWLINHVWQRLENCQSTTRSKVDIGGIYQQGLGINAVIEGSYQAVSGWIQQIEKLPYFISFTEVEISPLRLSTGIKAEFSGTIFFKNE